MAVPPVLRLPEKCACRWLNYIGTPEWYLEKAHSGCFVHKEGK